MILYVNGDSHAAAAEAAVPHAWAKDDEFFWGLGQRPHPENERVSFGCELANQLYAILQCDAQAGGSNRRIIRTTRQWLLDQENVKDLFLVLQWSTWEREEWFDGNDDWVQVNASGIDEVPEHFKQRYKEYIVDIDWKKCTETAHETIWQFHQELKAQGIRHVMFNGNNHFGGLPPRDWGTSYIGPYDPAQTYDSVLRSHGFTTVSPESWHFGADAHCFWGNYLLQYINNNQLLKT
jgi:hypothetical protein